MQGDVAVIKTTEGSTMWWLKIVFILFSASGISIFGLKSLHWHQCIRSYDALWGTPPVIDCGPHPFDLVGDYRRSALLNAGLIPPEELRPEELLQ